MPLTVETTSDQLPVMLPESTVGLGTPGNTGDKLKPQVVAEDRTVESGERRSARARKARLCYQAESGNWVAL